LSESSGSLVAAGDALGVLHGAAKFKAKDPGIKLIFMEMALIFAPQGSTIEALHIWSEENALADALSRLGQGLPCRRLSLRPRGRVLMRVSG